MTKMVQLSDEAYLRLKRLKTQKESFSDVVIRLTKTGRLEDLATLQTKKQIAESEALRSGVDRLDSADVQRLGRR